MEGEGESKLRKGPRIGGNHILVKGAAKAELLSLGGGGFCVELCIKLQFWGTGTVAGTESFRNQTTKT